MTERSPRHLYRDAALRALSQVADRQELAPLSQPISGALWIGSVVLFVLPLAWLWFGSLDEVVPARVLAASPSPGAVVQACLPADRNPASDGVLELAGHAESYPLRGVSKLPAQGGGADLGCCAHEVAMTLHLVGPIEARAPMEGGPASIRSTRRPLALILPQLGGWLDL